MKKAFALVILFLLILGITPRALAVCQKISKDASCASDKIQRDYTLDIAGTAQCTSGTNGEKRVCCDTQTEANAVDSVRAPLCGSSIELGKNNSSCWTCDDGSLRCSGLDFALAETDDAIYRNRAAIDGGDTSKVWRVTNHPSSFKFNGIDYTHTGDLIVCTANNKACGASNTQCHGLYPEDQNPPGQASSVEVPGETNFANVEVVKTFDRGLYDAIKAIGLQQLFLRSVGKVKPNEDTLHNPSPFLENMGKAMRDATSFALKPLMLQEQTIDATNCQQYEVTGRVCVYDEKGDLLNTDPRDQVTSTEKYISKDCNPAAKNERRQGLEYLAAIVAKYTKVDQNYEKPEINIKKDEPLGCEIKDPTVAMNTNITKSSGQNYFPIDVHNIPLGNVLISWIQIASNLFQARQVVHIVAQETILDKWEANSWCLGPNCEDANALARVKYPVDKAVVQSGGAFRSFQPYAHDFKGDLHGGDKQQEFLAEFSPGEVVPTQTAYSYANREEVGGTYVLCMISPLINNHVGLFTHGECDRDWQREKPPSPPPNVPNTSDWAISSISPPATFTPSGNFEKLLEKAAQDSGVPQCVMTGVGHIEGGSRYQELPLDQCLQTTNTCSAVGPMQFTVGPGHGKATEDACKNQCAAGFCPNAWATWGNGGNPCSYADSLSATGRMLAANGHFGNGSLQDSVHDAATAYYGSDNNALARKLLGGCEYWEFVYQHCVPSYVCQANR